VKIAISATEPGLDAEVDPRFGRCPYFTIIDTDTMQYETVENGGSLAGGGAGISSAQTISDKGVQAVLTGNCGPNAFQVLSSAGIKVLVGITGKVQDAVRDFKAGKYQASSQPSVGGHWGMNQGTV
jgi:predicted Fe-Mo cluster-binding NifX family protein